MKFALALAAMLIIAIPLFGQGVGAKDNLKTVGIDPFTAGDRIRVVRVMEGSTQIVPKVPSRRPSGQPFQAGENWLKDLTFVVKNLSDKEISAFVFRVDFPETGDDIPPGIGAIEGNYAYSKTAAIGRQPAMYVLVHLVAQHAVDSLHPAPFDPLDPQSLHPPVMTDLEFVPREADTTSLPIDILPGHELSVPLAPYNDEIKEGTDSPDRLVGKGKTIPFSAITTCWIFLQNVYFADGTRWSPGVFYKPDPNVPGKYAKWVPITADEFKNPTR
ncbi:MAG: hypothetical protein WB630_25115 [Candidatus Acidiferrales bacterium]